MRVIEGLKSLFAGAPRVTLEGTPAEGPADPAAGLLIRELRSTAELELREATATYLEGVLDRGDLDAFLLVLDRRLGAAVKPFGQRSRLVPELARLVDSCGGIEKNQSLHLRLHEDGRVLFAALWPWGDGKHVTLKAGVYDEPFAP